MVNVKQQRILPANDEENMKFVLNLFQGVSSLNLSSSHLSLAGKLVLAGGKAGNSSAGLGRLHGLYEFC